MHKQEFFHRDVKAVCISAQLYKATAEDMKLYQGAYVAIPERNAQTFETGNKTMTKNFKVEGIPFYEVSNRDGTTIIIGD